MPKVCVILSGCGFKDGGEIHESVLTLLSLNQLGADYFCVAPDMDQVSVVNHLTGDLVEEKRNVLAESARIARGEITDIAKITAKDMDAVIVPGGFGAAKNLCSFATDGVNSRAHSEVQRLLKEVHEAKKPIGAICIAPALLATIFGSSLHPKLTIGTDPGTAQALENMGVQHQNCPVEECYVDESNLMVTTAAYMLAKNIGEAQKGIYKLVESVLNLLGATTETNRG